MEKKGITFKVWGKRALFSNPIIKIGDDEMTYMVPTYQALKGIVESIYWKPTINWIIDRVRIMNPICTETVRVKKANGQIVHYTCLKDVCYQVTAHFEWNMNRPDLAHDRNDGKHITIAKRYLGQGGKQEVYLGNKLFLAAVEPINFDYGAGAYDLTDEIAFGLMLHDNTYVNDIRTNGTSENQYIYFWQPVMKKGVIEFIRPEECTICIKQTNKVNNDNRRSIIGFENFE